MQHTHIMLTVLYRTNTVWYCIACLARSFTFGEPLCVSKSLGRCRSIHCVERRNCTACDENTKKGTVNCKEPRQRRDVTFIKS